MDFPYRKAGRRAPDKPPVLVGAVVEEAEVFAAELGVAPEALALGGRSMGGRIASMAVADGLPAAALVLISYPLHPPGRPERPRTEHFSRLAVPCLFLSGTKDAFGSPEELEGATAAIPGPVTHRWLEGGDHGLRRRDDQVAALVTEWLQALR
jgi:predicted alpha/beta-hydrolase family hydrolase